MLIKPHRQLGLIVGNRGFFPDHLAATGREDDLGVLERAGRSKRSALTPEEIEVRRRRNLRRGEALRRLFERTAIRSTASSSRCRISATNAPSPNAAPAGLNVPVLVQATPDTPGSMTIRDRRDSFCGKMSACNNLMQYGIPYSLTTLHTEAPSSPEFARRSGSGFSASAASCAACAGCASGDRCAACGFQYGPLQREAARGERNLGRSRSIFRKILGRIDRMKDDDAAAQSETEGDSSVRIDARRAGSIADEDGASWAR